MPNQQFDFDSFHSQANCTLSHGKGDVMDIITITRMEPNPTETLGILQLNGQIFGVTLELPWKMNERSVSCIYAGYHYGGIYNSNKFNCKCIALYDVQGRNYISIHPGNLFIDTKGCILVGQYVDPLKDGTIRNSRMTLDRLVKGINKECRIIIREGW
jgi:hypothetical protein